MLFASTASDYPGQRGVEGIADPYSVFLRYGICE